MNLFERLLMRRLMAEATEGGDLGGGVPATPAESAPPAGDAPAPVTTAPASDPATPDPQKDGKPTDSPQDGKDKPPVDQKDKPKNEPGAPETYEFKAQEGTELDPAAIGAFEPIAKELNLTQEQAQKLVDFYPKLQLMQADVWGKQVEQWGVDAKADKEFGGDKFQANVGLAQKALDTFGTPELRTFLDTSGMGNHPEVIRAFMKVGKMMSEDSFVMPSNNNGGQLSAAEIIYGKK